MEQQIVREIDVHAKAPSLLTVLSFDPAIQPCLEKWTLQSLSTSCTTDARLTASFGETKTSFRGGLSPIATIGRILSLAVWIFEVPQYFLRLFRPF